MKSNILKNLFKFFSTLPSFIKDNYFAWTASLALEDLSFYVQARIFFRRKYFNGDVTQIPWKYVLFECIFSLSLSKNLRNQVGFSIFSYRLSCYLPYRPLLVVQMPKKSVKWIEVNESAVKISNTIKNRIEVQ